MRRENPTDAQVLIWTHTHPKQKTFEGMDTNHPNIKPFANDIDKLIKLHASERANMSLRDKTNGLLLKFLVEKEIGLELMQGIATSNAIGVWETQWYLLNRLELEVDDKKIPAVKLGTYKKSVDAFTKKLESELNRQ